MHRLTVIVLSVDLCPDAVDQSVLMPAGTSGELVYIRIGLMHLKHFEHPEKQELILLLLLLLSI